MSVVRCQLSQRLHDLMMRRLDQDIRRQRMNSDLVETSFDKMP